MCCEKAVILYFSATLNTKLIVGEYARTFADDGYIIEMIKAEELDKIKAINFDDVSILGIAYPCYAFDYPKKVIDPALNLIQKQSKNKPAFIINTYCINSGLSVKSIANILNKKNFDIISVGGFKCPSPGFISITSKDLTSKFKYYFFRKLMIFEDDILIKASSYGKEVIKSLNSYKEKAFQVTIKVKITSYFGRKLAKWNEKRIFNNYRINMNKCIGCMICVKQCPINNIQIVDLKAAFIDPNNCLRCMQCISNCPKDAITLGNQTEGMDRYTKKRRNHLLSDRM